MGLAFIPLGALSMVVLPFFRWADFRWVPVGAQLFHVRDAKGIGATAADRLVAVALGLVPIWRFPCWRVGRRRRQQVCGKRQLNETFHGRG